MKEKITVLIIIFLVFLCQEGNASTKYDYIKKDKSYIQALTSFKKNINHELREYCNTLISEKKITRIATTSIKLTDEQKKFIFENITDVKQLFQAAILVELNNNKVKFTDNELILITSVIKDPKTIAAKNQLEYEQEKMVLRGSVLYKLWENINNDDRIIENMMIHIFSYANSKK